MFDNLSKNLSKIFDKLTKRGFLNEDDVNVVMREIRIALLEADVALPIVKTFIDKVKAEIIGKEIIKSVSPSQMVIKLVQDNLIEMLGSEASEINLKHTPPVFIMMVGLQGSGKTTSSGKLALRLKEKYNKKILLASLDTIRPAAQQQLEVLAKQAGIDSLPIISGENYKAITERAIKTSKLSGYDVVILDTAGRLHIDEELMGELSDVKNMTNPAEILFVADAMTGQDAVNIANNFNETLAITGAILTRIDGDARGGAALSIKASVGCPIKYLGVGEKLTEFEEFHPKRIASRILDMGDIVSLVEKAAQAVDQEEAQHMAAKLQKGSFDLNDLAAQLKNIKKMGGMGGIMSMLPGIKKIKEQLNDSQLNEKILSRQEAIISSMTKGERRNPKIINASRKRRIAKGAGVDVQDINKLIKHFMDMSNMVKKFSKMDKKSLLRGGLGRFFS